MAANGSSDSTGGFHPGQLIPMDWLGGTQVGYVVAPTPYRQSHNPIEDKQWGELALDGLDVLVFKMGDKRTQVTREQLLKLLGLEW